MSPSHGLRGRVCDLSQSARFITLSFLLKHQRRSNRQGVISVNHLADHLKKSRRAIGRGGGSLSEAEALRLAQEGVPAGFEGLYQLHSKRMYRVCQRVTKSPTEAEELTQKAFLALFRNIHIIRQTSQLFKWLYRTTADVALLELRKSRRVLRTLDDVPKCV
ncbi:MAG: RNA polymerase sigma factor [Candidatus Acidiferrales bacterium]